MKTTLEIADATLQQARITAAQHGITLKELFNQALEEKLRRPRETVRNARPAWLKLEGVFGKTAAGRAETAVFKKRLTRSLSESTRGLIDDHRYKRAVRVRGAQSKVRESILNADGPYLPVRLFRLMPPR